MDWAKSKTILIIAFIITNILLGYNLYANIFKYDKRVFFEEEYIRNLNNLLKTKNITINTDLPKQTPKLSALSVKYEAMEENLEGIFQDNINLYIEDNKKIIYKGKANLKSFSKEESKVYTEKILKKYKLDKDSYLKYITKNNNFIEVFYCGKYKDYFLEESYMKFIFYPNGEFIFVRLWFIPIEDKVQKKRVITSVEAVMNKFNELKENSTIEDINLVYKFLSNENIDLSKTKIRTVFPMWRIKANKEYYYVPAFDF
ncbi:two-component system regulatory protein YycI [Tepidibacter formicigenes]|uniref:Two-component signal transduction system YycFG, regulatory protein YycI n=1 Tax=Tepidibacter formicigenes DSM 15518 TaxID=1123349 RepID=A0A1M6NKK5_9FIRM|nr:two-component system regulatory protein YycI [Tepidibacter formicigenes]SHJ96062.1 Two-component signal transduction system YycFG, regulatory protein YycI [Tepidibacter formicigenes DSM 15518]